MKNGKYEEDGTNFWYLNNQYHREDGSAVEYPDGSKEWYLKDEELTEDEFEQWKGTVKLNQTLQSSLKSKPPAKRVKI